MRVDGPRVGSVVKWLQRGFEYRGTVVAEDGPYVIVIDRVLFRRAGSKQWYRHGGAALRRNRNVVRVLER